MAVDEPSRRAGPVPLSELFDGVLQKLAPTQRKGAVSCDGILYSGNRQESVPRALFLDTRLTPLERNTWQVFRLLLNDHGITTLPTYDQLRPYLASMPCGARASHETVARALTLLRLTRWLSLVRRRRNPKTGRILGNLYVLHDEPLTPFEAMQLDADYLHLVSQALHHAAKAVQTVGLNTLKEIAEDPLLSGRTLPTRLQVQAKRMAEHGWDIKSYPSDGAARHSEESRKALLRNEDGLSSESEPGANPALYGALRIPKGDSTVSKKSIYKVSTVPRAHEQNNLKLPERFTRLKDEQQAGALAALRQVDETIRQAVLDEWDLRCLGDTVRNPAGYLFGIIQRAIRGEFNAWAGEANPPKPAAASPPSAPSLPQPEVTPPEIALEHLARLRELLRGY